MGSRTNAMSAGIKQRASGKDTAGRKESGLVVSYKTTCKKKEIQEEEISQGRE